MTKTKWKKVRLGEIARIKNGKTNSQDAVEGGRYPLFDRSAVVKGSDKYLFDETAIILPGEGADFVPRFFCGKFDLHQRAYAIIPDIKVVDAKFLYYFLLRRRKIFSQHAVGSTVKSLRMPIIQAVEVDLPLLPEQRRISTILSAFDEKIELNNKISRTLEEMAQAIFKEWFVEFRFPGHEKAEFVRTDLGRMPKGWKVGCMGDVAKIVHRNIDPSSVGSDTPYIGLEHMPRNSIMLTEWGFSQKVGSTKNKFKKGEILFGKLRPYFHKVGIAPLNGICSTDILVIVPKEPEMFAFALEHLVSNALINKVSASATGTKMPRTSWNDIAEYVIAIPPDQMLRKLNDELWPLFQQIDILIGQLRMLTSARDAAMSELLR